MEHADLPDDAALCLHCGICCEGVLHDHALSSPEEHDHLVALGLPLYHKAEYPAFALPCPCHIERQCTIYGQRPHTCGAYKCSLLRSALEEQRTFAECHDIVDQARAVMARIYETIGPRNSTQRIWTQARAFLIERGKEEQDADALLRKYARLFLDLNVLALLCGRHFERESFVRAWNWKDVEGSAGAGAHSAMIATK